MSLRPVNPGSVLDAPIILGVPIAQAVAWIGTHAQTNGRPEAARRCAKLVSQLGDTEIEIKVPAVHVLCQAIDYLREKQREFELIDELQRVVDLLKGAILDEGIVIKAGAPRVVSGTIHLVTDNAAREIERVAKALGV